MGILGTLRDLCFGPPAPPVVNFDARARSASRQRRAKRRTLRRCQVEALEPRVLMAADVAPQVLLGSVYFEEASLNDSAPDVIEVSFVGGAPGTTLDRLVINGDKEGNGLSSGDVIFDTAPGGLGVFGNSPFQIVSAEGFTVNSVSVVDGGSQIVFTFTGFQAGMKFRFSIDVDEVQYAASDAVSGGVVDPSKVDINSVVEGAEFQRSIMTGEFSAPGYVDLTLTGLYWDFFDNRFDTAQSATGLNLALPKDTYAPDRDLSVWTAGAVAHAAQIPLATLAGWVYHDRNDDGLFDRSTEQGIGGVTLELLDATGKGTGITTVTSSEPGKVGFYQFRDLFPGTYGVREVQPAGWLDGKDTAGSHGGAAADESAGPVDQIFGAVLNFGDHAVEYNFGELLPGSIRGRVGASLGPDCTFDNPDIPLAGVRIDLLDANGNFIRFTLTDSSGFYEFTDLAPAIYQVRQHQPAEYYDGGERVGTAGGFAYDVADVYSIIAGINITSDLHAINYDFCEKVGVNLSGHVYHDRSNDGIFNRPTEEGIGGVLLKLLDAQGNDTGLRATTDSTGYYQFTNLAAGTYAVMEVQPAGWLDGIDTPGNLGGVADASPGGDLISQITINWGQAALDYNFGELLPGSIAGRVGASLGPDCNFDNPDIPLGGVRIDLLDGSGKFIRSTTTDSQGYYRFDGLRPGQYQVFEHQPEGYYNGGMRVGTAGGAKLDQDYIGGIEIVSGFHAVNYDFCEHVGANLSGYVYHDRNDDGVYNRGTEEPIAGVVVHLHDAQGNLLRSTTTGSDGFYQFTNLDKGTYAVIEVQPSGWLDGKDAIGSLGGVIVASDHIGQVVLNYGDNGIEYNFGELKAGSIAGRVGASLGPDCTFDNPDIPLGGVRIDLFDGNGNFIRSTTTNSQGFYRFDGLRPGEYRVFEHQPAGYYNGGLRIGTAGGATLAQDLIGGIAIVSGFNAINYDFCEKVGVNLSGYVYHDRSNDGVFNRATEEGIGGVVLKLLDAQGNDTGLRATTDSSGYYQFTNLAAGTYAVMEVQPAGWLDGIDTPGNLGGIADASPGGDLISQITINWGQAALDYNFGELLPGSISGRVHAHSGPDCNFDNPEILLAGVRIDLLDASGRVIATTLTNAAGEYSFTNLPLGTYAVREHQPAAYFNGGMRLGTAGGVKVEADLMGEIVIGSDVHGVQYDFCEQLPSSISGYVFIDGPPIVTADPLTPAQIADVRDGRRTPDDTPLPGVVIELRNGVSGEPILVGQALAGHYAGAATDAIHVVTDANGFYRFTGLAAGTYAVVQVQPDGVIDSFDTPGSLGGFAVNPIVHPSHSGPIPSPSQQAMIETFREQFGNDAIIRIPLAAGQHSLENNFSEVTTVAPPETPPVPPQFPPPPPKPPVFPLAGAPYVPPVPLVPILPASPAPPFFGSTRVVGFTWHLSVVNAGWPRSMTAETARFQLAAAQIDMAGWSNVVMNQGRWTLATLQNNQVLVLGDAVFGRADALPVVGDWNGDGTANIGVFVDGQWFLDLNGNGVWDEGDLWAQLGSREDLPVTGDWDADGKTDIGIFGPAWPRDPWALMHEPGLPDAANFPTRPAGKMKNVPPAEQEAADGARLLKRSARGKTRADLIDHVFHYGVANDVPIAGDWNGDGVKQIGVFRDGHWHLDINGDGRFTEVDASFQFGQPGDLPVVGDWNGDGFDQIGVYRAGKWILDTNRNYELDATDRVFELGGAGDVPVVGDWNDDGVDDPGVYQPGATADRTARRAG